MQHVGVNYCVCNTATLKIYNEINFTYSTLQVRFESTWASELKTVLLEETKHACGRHKTTYLHINRIPIAEG